MDDGLGLQKHPFFERVCASVCVAVAVSYGGQ